MATDPTLQDRILEALGHIEMAHGCLLGSTIDNAGIIGENLAQAAVVLRGIVKEMPNES